MTSTATSPDPGKLEEQSGRIMGYLTGAMVSVGVWLGDELGLYRAMSGAGPVSSSGLALKTGLNERWVREWLAQQASAGLVSHEGAGEFELAAEAALILVDESTPASMIGFFAFLPSMWVQATGLPQCYRTGLGHKYDDHGLDGALSTRRATRPSTGLFLDAAIPSLEGVTTKLEEGAKVADIGCGSGGRLIALAHRYPQSEFRGYDISNIALGLAREETTVAGLSNLTFHNPDTDPLPADNSFDLVMFGDVIHDLAFPERVLRAARKALKPDGTMLVIDVAAGETLEENLANPMAPFLLGISQVICLSSSLSEPGGAGLGTLGLSPSLFRRLCEDAGFTRFRTTDVEDFMNNYYEVRP